MDSSEIVRNWENAQKLESKKKYAELRALCTEIISNIKQNSIDPAHIDTFMDMLTKAAKVGGYIKRYTKAKSDLVVIRLKNLEVDLSTVNITAKKSKAIQLESATFGIGDPSLIAERDFDINSEAINEKRRFYFSTGADGVYKLAVRVVDVSSPVLKATEYKKVISSTSTAQIEVKSGRLVAGDGCNTAKKKTIQLPIEPGHYNISAFLLGGRDGPTSYVAVLGKTSDTGHNKLHEIESLEFID